MSLLCVFPSSGSVAVSLRLQVLLMCLSGVSLRLQVLLLCLSFFMFCFRVSPSSVSVDVSIRCVSPSSGSVAVSLLSSFDYHFMPSLVHLYCCCRRICFEKLVTKELHALMPQDSVVFICTFVKN